ncbi:uncharacterized protein (TIGR02246 family) [Inhella inkyongensis]|uniref:Uncharacterized protein (TIGR02246 family) n=1 Tax=Inhella inkyongensis TaxID=392593 RepID=A0A840SB91_9BURK|nr:nuclear transport factor 2 family protein [Inhella inkyongensis]MBB5205619.1 uncharacterized protein (TIGR02246 family) [Inhella inkyongensis]
MPRRKAPLAVLMASPEEIEAQFYEALQTADIERLMSLWAEDEAVACVHPGGERHEGLNAIRASFEALFAQGALAVQPVQVRRLQTEGMALHQVHEQVLVPAAEQLAWVAASNVYLKTAQGWRLVLHHASPGQALELPSLAPSDASVLH